MSEPITVALADNVNVQALRGNNTDIEQNPFLGQRRLSREESWAIPSTDEDVYYHRDGLPSFMSFVHTSIR